MNSLLLLNGFVSLCVWALMAALLLLCAGRITRSFPKNAALRHLTWLTAFCVVPLLPGITAFVPSPFVLQAPLPQVLRGIDPSPLEVSRTGSSRGEEGLTSAQPVTAPSPGSSHQEVRLGTNLPNTDKRETSLPSVIAPEHETIPQAKAIRIDWSMVWIVLLGVWIMGVCVLFLQGLVAIYGLERLRRKSESGTFDSLRLPDLAARLGLDRGWELRFSRTSFPLLAMTWGFFRPVVLLPGDAITWPVTRLESVLLHELAHVQRADSLSQLLAFVVCALFWFNPLVWRCARAMREDAEVAADNTVLLSGIKPSTYAAELLQFAARLGHQNPPYSRIGVYIMKPSKIESRIESIIATSHCRRSVTATEVLKAISIGLFVALLLTAIRPGISFAKSARAGQDHGATRSSSSSLAERHPDTRTPMSASLSEKGATPDPVQLHSSLQTANALSKERSGKLTSMARMSDPQSRLAFYQSRSETPKRRATIPNLRLDLKAVAHAERDFEIVEDPIGQTDAQEKARSEAQEKDEEAKKAQREADEQAKRAQKESEEQVKRAQRDAEEQAKRAHEQAKQELEQAKKEREHALELAKKEIEQAKKEHLKAMDQVKKEVEQAKKELERAAKEIEKAKKEQKPGGDTAIAEQRKAMDQLRKELEQVKARALEQARKEIDQARKEIEQAKEQARKELEQAKKERDKAKKEPKPEQ